MITQGLNKPKEIFEQEKFRAYSPDMRFKYVHKLIREFINANDGLTKTEMQDELGLTYETVARHLERLEATGEIYKAIYGKTHVYFSNHKNMHPIGSREMDMDSRKFSFSILEQGRERLLFIQEKVLEPSGNHRLRGSIMIPLKNANEFFSNIKVFLQDFKETVGGK